MVFLTLTEELQALRVLLFSMTYDKFVLASFFSFFLGSCYIGVRCFHDSLVSFPASLSRYTLQLLKWILIKIKIFVSFQFFFLLRFLLVKVFFFFDRC